MTIGVPKEVKVREQRVALFPAGVSALTAAGHQVLIERGAGVGCGISDEQYAQLGARIGTRDEAWAQEFILKVKEPIKSEYAYLQPDLLLFTYLHLAADKALTERLVASGCTALAYESVELANGALPLLAPMSEIAGRMATLQAAQFLSSNTNGNGKLISGVTGVPPCKVVVLGAGVSGTNAAEMAVGLRADVTVMDVSWEKLLQVYHNLDGRVKTRLSSPEHIREELATADIVICCVLVPNAAAPRLVTREMIAGMRPGSVIVDVSIDQGGATELSRPTTHEQPCIVSDNGVLLYCVANMPGAYPRTSAEALTNATLPYALALANKGWRAAVRSMPPLLHAVNVSGGAVYCVPVAQRWGLPVAPRSALLE
jgi:alanine dehydrogenase